MSGLPSSQSIKDFFLKMIILPNLIANITLHNVQKRYTDRNIQHKLFKVQFANIKHFKMRINLEHLVSLENSATLTCMTFNAKPLKCFNCYYPILLYDIDTVPN